MSVIVIYILQERLSVMDDKEILNNIYDFFSMIIEYYKKLKRDKKYKSKVPSQYDIGMLFSDSLAYNYSAKKRTGRLTNIWSKNATDKFIVDDIYKQLTYGGLIPQEKLRQGEFVRYVDMTIMSGMNNVKKQCTKDESKEALIHDLMIFKEKENYEEYLKCVIEYANRKPGCLYISKFKKATKSNTGFELNSDEDFTVIEDKINIYKRNLRKRIMESDWHDRYVELHIKGFPFKLCSYGIDTNSIQKTECHSLTNVEDMLSLRDKMLLLGNPGAGKTTALLKIALDYLDNDNFLPVYIELNQYREQPVDEFIHEMTGIKLSEIKNQKCLILFDGLNELSIVKSCFYEYLKNPVPELAGHKIIVTCRLNNYKGNLLDYDAYAVLPISKSDVINFLEIEFPGKSQNIYVQMNNKLKELVATPLLLIMITGVFKYSSRLPNNLAELFQNFIEYILNQWETDKGNKYMACDKIEALAEFAYRSYFQTYTGSCSVEEAQRVLTGVFQKFGYSKTEQTMIYNEVLTNGIVRCKLFTYPAMVSFCHQSFLEYFASKALLKRVLSGDYDMFGETSLDPEILYYLKDMVDDNRMLKSIVFNGNVPENKNYLLSNALSLLHFMGVSLEKYNLANYYLPQSILKNANFYKTDLSNACLVGSDLRGVNLTETNLDDADLSDCKLNGTTFARCSIRSIAALETHERIAFVGDSNKLKVWDWKLNEVTVIGQHDRRVRKVDYDAVNGCIATGGYDNNIFLWDKNGNFEERLQYHNDPVLALAFSPDGKYLISGDETGKMVIYSVEGQRIIATPNDHKDAVREIIFLDNNYFVSASWDKTVVLWNLRTCKHETVLCRHEGYAFSVACHPNGKTVASVGLDGRINIIDVENRAVDFIIDTGNGMRDVEYSNDGQYLAVGGKDGKVQIWSGKSLCAEWKAHYFRTRDFIFVKDNMLITSGDDSSIKIWDIDYDKGSSNCTFEMVDEEINGHDTKSIKCKGLNITNAHGLTPERKQWLLDNGAFEMMKFIK